MKKKKLSCFIASALGKDDVDEIYKNSFDSVLKELHIQPKRVDLIEHNEDIDDKIIELINECDFCIADLTYARPSVYFEAGYFVGLNKSVIFTARSDHFIPKEDDIFGNYKIHFDLQMKNIIRWSSTTKVKTFNSKLKSRIKFVTKSLLKYFEEKNKEDLIKNKFKRLSQKNKLISLNRAFIKKFYAINAERIIYKPAGYEWHLWDSAFKMGNNLVTSFITTSATKEFFRLYIDTYQIKSRLFAYASTGKEVINIIITSLRKIPNSRIEDTYPSFEMISDSNNTYYGQISKSFRDKKHYRCYLHFVSDIKSIDEYNKLLTNKIEEISRL